MSRIAATFDRIRREDRPGLVTYVTAGDPDLVLTERILQTLDAAGADVLEVGVPFSDPLADGPVIQRASERALAAGTTLEGVLRVVERVRPSIAAPIVLFSYANPLYRMGFDRFATAAASAGVDGALVLDLPMEESAGFHAAVRGAGMDMIFLLSPTTSSERMRVAGQMGSGFVYAISRLGVTGARDAVAEGAGDLVARIRAATPLPIAVGFGVSSAAHVRQICASADAAVVGSALVKLIEGHGSAPDLLPVLDRFVRGLKA